MICYEASAVQYTRISEPAPELGPLQDDPDGMLLANAGRARREGLTLMRVFGVLRGLGFDQIQIWVTVKNPAQTGKRDHTVEVDHHREDCTRKTDRKIQDTHMRRVRW